MKKLLIIPAVIAGALLLGSLDKAVVESETKGEQIRVQEMTQHCVDNGGCDG